MTRIIRASGAGERRSEPPSRQDSFRMVEAEHDHLRAQLRKAIGDARERANLAEPPDGLGALCDAVRGHMEREDRTIYPICERLFGPHGAVSVMRVDHATIERELADLGEGTRRERVARLEQLASRLEVHIGREERVLFPIMTALLSRTELERIRRGMTR